MAAGRIRVLLVDDTSHVRELLTAMLNIDGFEVVADAADGATALTAAQASQPDVVVVDYKMPDVDGLETARRLRAACPEQRVILYTAFADGELQAAAAAAGATLCLKTEGLSALEQEIARVGSVD
jgi:DNA-binding NarL/FixJ family response regulator